MTALRPFVCDDLYRFNRVNLDPLTETYNMAFYLNYLARWPDYCAAATTPSGEVCGYVLGKAEGEGQQWHGHVTALSVDTEHRRIGLASRLMALLEETSERDHAYFVDLFVRVSNQVAVRLYRGFGYEVYREIKDYYSSGSDTENAYDMRKSMSRDPGKQSMVPIHRLVDADEVL